MGQGQRVQVQFKAAALKTVPPTTAEGIERHLGSGLVNGIGPILAKKLVGRFGAEVLAVIEERLSKLQSASGIGPKHRPVRIRPCKRWGTLLSCRGRCVAVRIPSENDGILNEAFSTSEDAMTRANYFRAILFGVIVSMIGTVVSQPALADDKDKIVGTWKLVSVVYEDVATGQRTPVLGAHPRGCQIATPEGRWLAVVTAEGRKVPQTDAERSDALRSMIAYTGRYRVEDGKVITRVEAAWNEAWVGTDQIRAYKFEGDRLLIESPPQPHPNLMGKMVRIIVIWERDK